MGLFCIRDLVLAYHIYSWSIATLLINVPLDKIWSIFIVDLNHQLINKQALLCDSLYLFIRIHTLTVPLKHQKVSNLVSKYIRLQLP